MKSAQTDLKIASDLNNRGPFFVAKGAFEKARAAVEEAEAGVNSKQADLNSAQLNLSSCKVTAPIGGKLAETFVSVGSVVAADMSKLATVIQTDPMRVSFDVRQSTALKLNRLLHAGKISVLPGTKLIPIVIHVDDQTQVRAEVDLGNLQIEASPPDISQPSARLHALLPNPDGALIPGASVQVRLVTSPPYQAYLLPFSALGSSPSIQTYTQYNQFIAKIKDSKVSFTRGQTNLFQGHGEYFPAAAFFQFVEIGGSPVEKLVFAPDDWYIVAGLDRTQNGQEVRLDVKPLPPEPPATRAARP